MTICMIVCWIFAVPFYIRFMTMYTPPNFPNSAILVKNYFYWLINISMVWNVYPPDMAALCPWLQSPERSTRQYFNLNRQIKYYVDNGIMISHSNKFAEIFFTQNWYSRLMFDDKIDKFAKNEWTIIYSIQSTLCGIIYIFMESKKYSRDRLLFYGI